ncbi:hypothetical protein F2Q68_00034968 [Brassica cretica]|uniref:Uncharacterized protein n=1 Tax=Brassica cretica TaxID=69181 RepID=A0A8S9H7E1_BRACR|nr:hypothetical protein F2Q68_00034968 [Brassica cretica]
MVATLILDRDANGDLHDHEAPQTEDDDVKTMMLDPERWLTTIVQISTTPTDLLFVHAQQYQKATRKNHTSQQTSTDTPSPSTDSCVLPPIVTSVANGDLHDHEAPQTEDDDVKTMMLDPERWLTTIVQISTTPTDLLFVLMLFRGQISI